MNFYQARAAETRCDAYGNDIWVNEKAQKELFEAELNRVSDNIISKVSTLLDFKRTWWNQGFDGNGSIDEVPHSVITAAFQQIDPRSSPGFPFESAAQNSAVNLNELHQHVAHVWSLLNRPDFDELFSFDPEAPTDENFLRVVGDLYQQGHIYPASVFIKGEPTGKSKLARLIYGNSLVLNVVSHILFCDVINQLPSTQLEGHHSIGLDFLSEEGVDAFANKLRAILPLGSHVVSDDVQGWEYMVRYFMWEMFCRAFIHSIQKVLNKHDTRITRIYRNWAKFTATRLVCLGDGTLVVLPRFWNLSGIYETHFFNSETRSTLARLDAKYAAAEDGLDSFRPGTDSNGDDNFSYYPKYIDPERWGGYSKLLGFKHTDVFVDCWKPGGRIEFCSQDIVLRGVRSDGSYAITMEPHSVAKSVYNMCDAILSKDKIALLDLLRHLSRAQLGSSALAYAQAVWLREHGEELDIEMA